MTPDGLKVSVQNHRREMISLKVLCAMLSNPEIAKERLEWVQLNAEDTTIYSEPDVNGFSHISGKRDLDVEANLRIITVAISISDQFIEAIDNTGENHEST